MTPIKNSSIPFETAEWVPETRFGKWFISTHTWFRYVLKETVCEFKAVLGERLPAGAVMLDTGCGIGLSFGLLNEYFHPKKIIGIDVDLATLKIAAESTQTLNCDIELLHGSAKQMDIPDNSIDAVFCHQLIHHVSAQEAVLKEIYRTIRPGGFLLSSESCSPFINSFWVRLLFRHPDMVQKEAHEYVALIRAAGFTVAEQDIKTSTPWWSRVDFGLLKKWKLSSWHPGITEVIVVAQKPAI
jgi:ubiquinone/menaquinone biosynthesis C-methylase UbiE